MEQKMTQKTPEITEQELKEAFVGKSESKPSKTKSHVKFGKKFLVFLIIGIVGFIGGITCLLIALLGFKKSSELSTFPSIPSTEPEDAKYSLLTGELLADDAKQNAPVYCIQTPNGTDGARPQAGLTDAGVIFEAIAEAGITRFAAIYQNPTSSIIGPIRSLRIYYLQWDTPFDCTVVHAGGASDALSAVSSGKYRNLDESTQYMYRGTYGARAWNNLFTTSKNLAQFNSDHDYTTSEVKSFARMTPKEANAEREKGLKGERLNITKPTDQDTSKIEAKVSKISFNYASSDNFNVRYTYNASTNSYNRSYASNLKHEVYKCPTEDLGSANPEDKCTLTTISPNVVIAMIVSEKRASDNYHENITAIGSGKVYIFQNGEAIEGNWSKTSAEDQIKFLDKDNNEIKLAPGQTFISAIPNYGSVEY